MCRPGKNAGLIVLGSFKASGWLQAKPVPLQLSTRTARVRQFLDGTYRSAIALQTHRHLALTLQQPQLFAVLILTVLSAVTSNCDYIL